MTVETYQWFVRNAGSISDAYTIVICDEAHTALGEKTSGAIRAWSGPIFIGMTATGALIARHVTDLFPTRIRFTGVALIFNVSFTLFSGMAPLAATTLIRETGSPVSPAYLMMGSAALALLGSLWVDRHGGNVLKTGPAATGSQAA